MLKQLAQLLSHDTPGVPALDQVRALELDLCSARTRFAVPYVFEGGGELPTIRPSLRGDEAEPMYAEALALQPATVVQVGARTGGCLYWWAQAATDDAVIVSVRRAEAADGGAGEVSRRRQAAVDALVRSFGRAQQTVRLIGPGGEAEVEGVLDGRAVDLLFMDAAATAEAVVREFNAFAPAVRADGLIVLHGIAAEGGASNGRRAPMAELWPRLRERYETREYVADGSRRGVGVVVVPAGGVERVERAG
ncbi:MAG: class I SAM-dependent methyltransferase [Planctomycetota bacterium]